MMFVAVRSMELGGAESGAICFSGPRTSETTARDDVGPVRHQ